MKHFVHAHERKFLLGLFAIVLLALLARTDVTAFIPLRAQPQLLALAAQTPDATVSVIVQKTVRDHRVEDLTLLLGGKITSDLFIINGFSAELKAQAIPQLARADGVRWVSFDAPVRTADCGDSCWTTGKLVNNYIKAVNANKVWSTRTGQGIGVAVVDSGVNWQGDLYTVAGVNRTVANIAFNPGYNTSFWDGLGHGTHIAGVIGMNGRTSDGMYIGVAPRSNIINVKVSDDQNNGAGTAKSVVLGLQWILQNKNTYNIRVVNLSLNSAIDESYHTNPIDAAVEILWFNKIVVVTSAGNRGAGTVYPPANDPFVITVGATTDNGTVGISDDSVASFSAFGNTKDGFTKPDIVAPGTNVVSLMSNSNSGLATSHPGNVVYYNNSPWFFRMSGTSVSAPIVSGAVALLLQDEPWLTPDQVKYRLMATANKSWGGYNNASAGAGYLDAYAALNGTTTQSANTGLAVSKLLTTGSNPVNSSVNWNSVNWNSVNWNSVNWNSVNWNSVNWNSDYWGNGYAPIKTAADSSTAPKPPRVISLGDLTANSVKAGKGWKAQVAVTVVNDKGRPVQGAQVIGRWKRDSATVTCTTDEQGQCMFTSDKLGANVKAIRFVVVDILRANVKYDASANSVSATDIRIQAP